MAEITILTIGTAVLVLVSLVLSEYNFFSPSFIVCMMMLLSSSIALYATYSWNVPQSYYSMEATFIILSGLVVFIICEQFAKKMFAPKRKLDSLCNDGEDIKPIHLKKWLFAIIIIIGVASSIAYCMEMYIYVGQNGYKSGFDIGEIAKFYHKMTFWDEKKGGISWIVGKSALLVRAIMYVCVYVFVNNVVGVGEKIRNNIFLVLPIIAGVPVNLVSSSRSSLLQIAGAFVVYVYVFMCRKKGWIRMRKNFSKISKMAITLFCVAILAFYTAASTGLIGRVTTINFFDYIAMYVGAPIIHFNQFITSPPADVTYFGEETFAGLNSFLVHIGLRSDVYSRQLENRTIVFYTGNVYTFFRRPLHDFGLLGMYIVVGLTSYAFSRTYYKKIYRKGKSYKTDRTLILYGFFYYVIYLFSIMNDWCNLISTNTVYFIFFFYLTYAFITEHIKLRKAKLIITKR